MANTHAPQSQSQSSTSKSTTNVQRSAAGGLRAQARGMDFAQAEAMYAPVQKRATQREAKASEAPQVLAQDVGEVGTIPGFGQLLSTFLQASLPNVGNSASVALKGVLAAPPFIGKIGLEGEASRTTTGFEVKGKFVLDLGVGAIVPGFEASATVQLSTELSGKADSIDECLRIAMIPTHAYLKVFGFNALVDGTAYLFTGKDVADLLFGETFLADVLAKMDPAGSGEETDSMTAALGVGVAAGVSADPTASLSAGANGNLGYRYEQTLTKGEDGKLSSAGEHKLEGGATVKIGPVAASFKFSQGEKLTTDLELECTLSSGLGQVVATYASTVWDQISAVLVKGAEGQDSAAIKKLVQGELRSVALTSLSGWFNNFAATPFGELCGAVSEYTIKGTFTYEDGTITRAKLTSESKQGMKKTFAAGGGVSIAGELKNGSVLMDRSF